MSRDHRTIRAIYEEMHKKNFKNGLRIANQHLQKNHQSVRVKALKAQVLYQMDEPQQSLQILNELRDSPDTLDDASMHVMEIVYRLLGKPIEATLMHRRKYEREPQNEELAVSLFDAYAKAYDPMNQQMLAMQMYKRFGKDLYLHWMAASLMQQARRTKDTSMLRMAELFLGRRIQAENYTSSAGMQLYLSLLELQKKYAEALALLRDPRVAKLMPTPEDRMAALGRINLKAERYGDACRVYKCLLEEFDSDNWDYACGYLDACEPLLKDALQDNTCPLKTATTSTETTEPAYPIFEFDALPERIRCKAVTRSPDEFEPDCTIEAILAFIHALQRKGFQQRGPFLMELIFAARLKHANIAFDDSALAERFVTYFDIFSTKQCCPFDLQRGVNILSDEQRTFMANELARKIPEDAPDSTDSMKKVQRHYRIVQASYAIRLMLGRLDSSCVDDLLTVFEQASETIRAIQRVRPAEEAPASPDGTTPPPANSDPFELEAAYDYILLASKLLWDAHEKDGCPQHLVRAAALLEHAIETGTQNYHFRLHLLRVYAKLGCGTWAWQHFRHLGIKHVQHLSMNHLLLHDLYQLGTFSEATQLAGHAQQFYEEVVRESPELPAQAFHNEKYDRLEDYGDFRGQMEKNLEHANALAERNVIHVLEHCDSAEDFLTHCPSTLPHSLDSLAAVEALYSCADLSADNAPHTLYHCGDGNRTETRRAWTLLFALWPLLYRAAAGVRISLPEGQEEDGPSSSTSTTTTTTTTTQAPAPAPIPAPAPTAQPQGGSSRRKRRGKGGASQVQTAPQATASTGATVAQQEELNIAREQKQRDHAMALLQVYGEAVDYLERQGTACPLVLCMLRLSAQVFSLGITFRAVSVSSSPVSAFEEQSRALLAKLQAVREAFSALLGSETAVDPLRILTAKDFFACLSTYALAATPLAQLPQIWSHTLPKAARKGRQKAQHAWGQEIRPHLRQFAASVAETLTASLTPLRELVASSPQYLPPLETPTHEALYESPESLRRTINNSISASIMRFTVLVLPKAAMLSECKFK